MPKYLINKVLSVDNLHDIQSDIDYWLKQSPQDRISAIEMMRRINYGKDVTTTRLQRFFEIAELSKS